MCVCVCLCVVDGRVEVAGFVRLCVRACVSVRVYGVSMCLIVHHARL